MLTYQYSRLHQAVEICRKYTQLHADYADEIAAAMRASVERGTPVNPPIWWLDPEDEVALAVWDGKSIYKPLGARNWRNFKRYTD